MLLMLASFRYDTQKKKEERDREIVSSLALWAIVRLHIKEKYHSRYTDVKIHWKSILNFCKLRKNRVIFRLTVSQSSLIVTDVSEELDAISQPRTLKS